MNKDIEEDHQQFEEALLNFCGPIYIAPSITSPPSETIANGSFGLIDTGERKVLVTCCHVWDAYEDEKMRNPEVVLAVVLGTGLKTYSFTPEVIDADRDIDLAVFKCSDGNWEEKSPIKLLKDLDGG